ncbi:F-actin-uncapping protein LRRC16A-like isoform X2 [Paramisgurnus dabryanus]|uniref:F-actin-uncapping protein LRRC16A-like isoform X2 n=1 Tax=Paramisgurnus dabryanus TaxID=90735 RepID=UPI003CCF01C3
MNPGDIPQDLMESVQDAVGQQVKLCVIMKVNLEVKGERFESRILALALHRVFLLSARIPAKIEQSCSVFDIQRICSVKQNQLLLDYDKGQMSLQLTPDQQTDDIIAQIGRNIQEICPGLDPMRVLKKLVLEPTERSISLQSIWKNHSPTDPGPCGGFSRIYWCVCDQLNVPYRDEVQWDVDTIYLSQDSRELCLQDFMHLDNRDLVAIIAALEFSQWFIKLSIKDIKLTADLCEQILRVVSRSTKLEELTLENTGLKSDFAVRFASALSQNPNSSLHTINFSNNCLEDKGVVVLSSVLSKLTSGLKQMDLSKNSLSHKGVNILAQCFSSDTLTHLYLSGNTLKGDDMPNLWNFLSHPNNLHTLDLSNSECSLDLVCSSLLRGSLKHMSVLNMSRSVFSYKKGKEFPSSFKQFFSSALSLQTVCLSGTKLPPEALKALLLGLACNANLRDVSLDISSCDLRSAGSQILEGCIAEIPNIISLDISDNGLDSDLSTLLVWLGKNRSIKHLSIGRNFSNIKTKNLGQVLVSLLHMIQDEESPLMSLSLADSRLKADLSVVLNAVGGNTSLTHLDISGNSMGDIGAKMLGKALQINTKLRTVMWDRNCVSAQGLQDVAAALEKNYTIRFMPVPIIDAAQALKNSPEKTEDALLKMEQYLLRNHESRRYMQEQAFRLQQGIVTSTTQQLISQVCVQVQDQLNSLCFSKSDRVQQDIKTAEKLIRDAKSSKTLLSSLYHLRSGGRVAGVSDGSAGVCVQQVHEKLCSVAGEISAVINQQLQSLFVSMLDTAESVCPHVMQKVNLRDDLLHANKEKMSVSQTFITSTLLEQSAIDIINKISEVKFSMASCLSDHITDEILQSLSGSQHILAGHLSCREKTLLFHETSQETEVVEEIENLVQPQQSQEEKRRTVYSRMFRPVSAAFNLGFDLSKALEDVSVYMEDLPPPPAPMSPIVSPWPMEAELQQPQTVCFSDLPTVDTPALQHVTKYRPRRTKKAKTSRAAPVSKVSVQDPSIGVDQLDEGVPEFFFKKVTNIRAKAVDPDVEITTQSLMSPIINKTTPGDTTTTTTTVAMVTAETSITPTVTAVDPCIPTVEIPEVKGHVQEGVKRDGPLVKGHVGVQVLGGDMLMEIRAKQEKRKKDKAGVSSSVEPKAEPHTEGVNHGHTTAEVQKDPSVELTAQTNKLKHTTEHTHTPAQTAILIQTLEYIPVQTHTPAKTPTSAETLTSAQTLTSEQTLTPAETHTPAQTPTLTPAQTPTLAQIPAQTPTQTPAQTPTLSHTPAQTPTLISAQTPTLSPTPAQTPTLTQSVFSTVSCLSQESGGDVTPPPLDDITDISTGGSSPALLPSPLCQWDSEWGEQSPVTQSTRGGDSPKTCLDLPGGVVVFETDSHKQTQVVVRSVSCVHSRNDSDKDAADRQRTQSLPTADGPFNTSDSAGDSGVSSESQNTNI